jgi:hypothetical protein
MFVNDGNLPFIKYGQKIYYKAAAVNEYKIPLGRIWTLVLLIVRIAIRVIFPSERSLIPKIMI